MLWLDSFPTVCVCAHAPTILSNQSVCGLLPIVSWPVLMWKWLLLKRNMKWLLNIKWVTESSIYIMRDCVLPFSYILVWLEPCSWRCTIQYRGWLHTFITLFKVQGSTYKVVIIDRKRNKWEQKELNEIENSNSLIKEGQLNRRREKTQEI